MRIPPLFDADKAKAVVSDITWTVFRLAPPGWKHVRLDFREVGLYHEVKARVDLVDGSQTDWDVPYPVLSGLNFLRLGMRFNRGGTWHSAVMDIEFPGPEDSWISRNIEFEWEGEPEFQGVCPVSEYRQEIRDAYDDAYAVQTWLITRATLPDNPLREHAWFAAPDGDEPALCGGEDAGPGDDVPEDLRAALISVLPEGWASVEFDVRALGHAQELSVFGNMPDGEYFVRSASEDLIRAVSTARRAESDADRGAWFKLRVVLVADGTATVRRDYESEPEWKAPVSGEEYGIELREFPRPDYAIPDWLRSNLKDAPERPPRWAPALRQAEVFDGFIRDEKKYLSDRPGLEYEEAEKVLAYLKAGALVLTARTVVGDEIFRDVSPAVPLGFQTDGTWIWPQAVVYYLERYRMPPQTALLEHIRAAGHVPPGVVSEDVLAVAREQLCQWIEARVAI